MDCCCSCLVLLVSFLSSLSYPVENLRANLRGVKRMKPVGTITSSALVIEGGIPEIWHTQYTITLDHVWAHP